MYLLSKLLGFTSSETFNMLLCVAANLGERGDALKVI